MQALRRINNNVALCRDGSGRELIAMGKGVGFGSFPRELALSEIERTFYDTDETYRQLVAELPEDVLAFAARIVEIAGNELPYALSPNAAFTLADHISFAMERARKNIRVKMPLAYDSKLTQDEPQSAETDRDEEMLEDVTEIVENELHILVERSGFNYSRYATHMQYLFQRIHTGQAIRSDNLQLYTSLREEFPEIAACVEKIAQHIEREWHSALTEEEKLYLILHVNRICIKEGM